MNWKITAVFISLLTYLNGFSQFPNPIKGEYGVQFGTAHYFGDLNTRAKLNKLKPMIGVFYQKQFGNYVGVKAAINYAELGYSDIYSSKNLYQKKRNLSFNSSITEISLQANFNFFKYTPDDNVYNFTPYTFLGLGVFNYNPYAYLDGKKYFLRPLGTEGQLKSGKGSYGSLALAIPVGGGVKYSFTEAINLFAEFGYRYTTTDYLDDVSKTYVGVSFFNSMPNGLPSPVQLLQDRSYEIDPANILGQIGRQRGNSKQKDSYIFFNVGVSFNISSGATCPKS